MLFSKLYKIMVNKATFVGLRGAMAPLDPPLRHPHFMLPRLADAVETSNTLFFL